MPLRLRPLLAAILACSALAPLEARAAGQGVYGPLPLRPKDAELVQKASEMEELFVRRGEVLPPDAPESQLVRKVGERVTASMKLDPYVHFRFAVVDSPVPNAFALPDGQVYIHRGLLAILENEAQLASVLAHESVHVEGHHSIVNARQARAKQGGMVALGTILGDIGSLINIAFEAAIIGYGRDLEQEADLRGVEHVLAAGYDPREMPRVFELLAQDPEGERTEGHAAWSSHPLTAQRSAYTSSLLETMKDRIEAADAAHPLEVGEEDFLAQTAPTTRDVAKDFIAMDRPRTALSLAQRLVERWPDDARNHSLVGSAYLALDARTPEPLESELTKAAKRASRRERTVKTPYERAQERLKEGGGSVLEQNAALARRAFEEALRLQPDELDATLGLARLDADSGKLADAGRRYVAWLRAAPASSPDRADVVRRLSDVTTKIEAQLADRAAGTR